MILILWMETLTDINYEFTMKAKLPVWLRTPTKLTANHKEMVALSSMAIAKILSIYYHGFDSLFIFLLWSQ